MKHPSKIIILIFFCLLLPASRNSLENDFIFSSYINSFPANKPLSCEQEWVIRNLHYHPVAMVPRRMYFASCNKNSDKPRFYASFSLGKNAKHPKKDPSSGALMEAVYNPKTKQLEQNGKIRHFPECVWAEGIAVNEDCSSVAMLCRRKYSDKDYDYNALATHESRKWMTQPKCAKLSMYLYEFKNGDIHSKPKKTLLHKANDYTWENGSSYLRIGESDNTYGIGLKSRVVDPKGQCHEADAFLVMDKQNHEFTKRGYSWACGTGHTTFNRPVYNPYTRKYAVLCSTDGSKKHNTGKLSGFYLRLENQEAIEFGHTNNEGIHTKGGTGTLIALEDGGFMGVLVGVNGVVRPVNKVPKVPPTSIGLIRFDRNGKTDGIKWIIHKKDVYLSWPQLTQIAKDRFLLGFADMKKITSDPDPRNHSLVVPWTFYLQEMDINGKSLSQTHILRDTGWGEIDEMVSLGRGRIAWAYVPEPVLKDNAELPDCNQNRLKLSVFHSEAKIADDIPESQKFPYKFSIYIGNQKELKELALCESKAIKGLQWYHGAIIDRVRAICSDDTKTLDLGSNSGNGPKDFICSGSKNHIASIKLWPFGHGGAIERLQIFCEDGQKSEIVGGWDAKARPASSPIQCPQNSKAVGLRGNMGDWLNGLGLVCQ